MPNSCADCGNRHEPDGCRYPGLLAAAEAGGELSDPEKRSLKWLASYHEASDNVRAMLERAAAKTGD